MSKLALLGGKPVIEHPLQLYRSIGAEEKEAVIKVMDDGCLSGFVGAWCDEFHGGPLIQQFEDSWAKRFGVGHAVTMNSNTSGLIAAMGAVGVGPGDEVIIPAWSMSATAMAPIFYGGIPVFADIEDDFFCLDLESVRSNITDKTKAIIAVNLFGHPAELKSLRALADEFSIKLIEDNAQAPLGMESGLHTGTIGHIGVFSLNYHKHIHTGEGGVCTTDDDELAMKLKMIRNHGENVVSALNIENLENLVGYNFRMTELSAAVGLCQLEKMEVLVGERIALAEKLSSSVKDFSGITPPLTRENCQHVYYLWGAKYDEKEVGIGRDIFAKALEAEGCPTSVGYVEPLYLLPLFQKRIAIGAEGFPFNLSNRIYERGLCPVTEHLHEKEMLEFFICSYQLAGDDLDRVIDAYCKVYENRNDLVNL